MALKSDWSLHCTDKYVPRFLINMIPPVHGSMKNLVSLRNDSAVHLERIHLTLCTQKIVDGVGNRIEVLDRLAAKNSQQNIMGINRYRRYESDNTEQLQEH